MVTQYIAKHGRPRSEMHDLTTSPTLCKLSAISYMLKKTLRELLFFSPEFIGVFNDVFISGATVSEVIILRFFP